MRGTLVRFVQVCFLLLITGLGVWLASSLVAFAGGPPLLACVAGVLLFPVLPLWWEKRATDAFYAQLKRATRLLPKKRALTPSTRIALRTVAVNVLFVVALLALWPKVAFAALATRGDWFLGQRQGPWVDRTRTVLLTAASSLEWLHTAARENPYRTAEDTKAPVIEDVKPSEVTVRYGSGARWRHPDPPTPTPVEQPVEQQPEQPEQPPIAKLGQSPVDDAPFSVGATSWPWPSTPHPVVMGMTAADESSPEAVARYISARVTDPFERVKALHDWVVTRLKYDHDSVTGVRKPQNARAVFDGRMGVCEGYARLMVELGRLTGDRVVYVIGEVREEHGALMPVHHAWNAVEIRGAWYLLDATWDDPSSADGSDEQSYRTEYLFIPPQVAGFDHYPDDSRWQLRDVKLSRAAFLRQPMTGPGLAREQLALTSPAGPVVDVDDTFTLKLENPRRVYVSVEVGDAKCGPSNAESIDLQCDVPDGAKVANVFSNHDEYGTYDFVASFKLQ